MQLNKPYQTQLICGNVWMVGVFFLLINPTLYGFAASHRADLPWPSQDKNDSLTTDTLPQSGLIIHIKGQRIVVADEDLPTRVHWNEAQTMCNQLGKGWRLPTKGELEAMYTQLHLQGRGNFYGMGYWSGQEVDATNAWVMYFLSREKHPTRKLMPIKVRPVRTP